MVSPFFLPLIFTLHKNTKMYSKPLQHQFTYITDERVVPKAVIEQSQRGRWENETRM